MKRLGGFLRLILLLPLLTPANVFALASSPTGIMIVELQTTGLQNATNEEFIELYNPTTQTVDISSWKLQYLSAGGNAWQTKATLNGYIYPNGRLLLASSDYLIEEADISFTSGFKLEAGHVRIVSPDPEDEELFVVEDLLGWGTALYPEMEAADYAPAGSSLVRKVNTGGAYTDSNNNKQNFQVSSLPSPESFNVAPEQEEQPEEDEEEIEEPVEDIEEELPEEAEEVIPEEAVEESIIDEELESALLQPIQITELLPNPAAPASDSTDEYIELYNPNTESFDLTDYKLQTGNAFSYSYTFDGEQIPAGTYMVLYVSETGLTLANSSGQARMISPNGTVTFQTDSYETAKDGEAWSYIDGVWQWTLQPTAGTTNIFVAPTVASTSASTKTSSTKKPKKATAKKPAQPKKAAKPKTAKKTGKDTEVAGVTDSSGSDEGGGTSPIHMWVIAAVGAIAVGYALYEYKDDIRNRILQFRRNRAISRSARAST